MLELCFQRTRFGAVLVNVGVMISQNKFGKELVNAGVMLRRTRFDKIIGILWSYASRKQGLVKRC
jgi:hypothetical protein